MAKFSNRFLRGMNTRKNYTGNKNTGKHTLMLALMFIPVFLYVWLYIQSMKMNYEVNRLEITCENLRAENKRLQWRMQTMMSSETIEKVACEKYGFVRPDSDEVFVIRKENGIISKIFGAVSGMFGKKGGGL